MKGQESRVMLNLNGTWMASNFREHILHSSHKPTVKKYYNKRFNWQEGTSDTVYWKSIKQVRNKMRLAKFRQMLKIMCGWLPTNVMRSYIKGVGGCPGCRS